MSALPRRVAPQAPARRGWCPSLMRPMPSGDGLLARVHPRLGILSAAQLRALAEAARRYGNGHLDVTARGNLQIRASPPPPPPAPPSGDTETLTIPTGFYPDMDVTVVMESNGAGSMEALLTVLAGPVWDCIDAAQD